MRKRGVHYIIDSFPAKDTNLKPEKGKQWEVDTGKRNVPENGRSMSSSKRISTTLQPVKVNYKVFCAPC